MVICWDPNDVKFTNRCKVFYPLCGDCGGGGYKTSMRPQHNKASKSQPYIGSRRHSRGFQIHVDIQILVDV